MILVCRFVRFVKSVVELRNFAPGFGDQVPIYPLLPWRESAACPLARLLRSRWRAERVLAAQMSG